ncbi:MAG: peptidoglycan-associated lipoprotein Pal [Oryzomonas sp.]|nr:peptidoglycan-associated lipoprotein Pal [Oryzomonas sp.]
MVKKDETIAPSATVQAKQTDVKAAKNGLAGTSAQAKPAMESAGKEAATKAAATNAAPQSKEQLTSALEKIYFAFDSFGLSDDARKTLTENAGYLRKSVAAKLRIEGNCDERGSAEYNIALGEKRAEAAEKYLVTMGIPADRLATVSYGKEKPADPGHDESAWAKNRRDDFTILTK